MTTTNGFFAQKSTTKLHAKLHVINFFIGYDREPSAEQSEWLRTVRNGLVRAGMITGIYAVEQHNWLDSASAIQTASCALGWEVFQQFEAIKSATGWAYLPFGGITTA